MSDTTVDIECEWWGSSVVNGFTTIWYPILQCERRESTLWFSQAQYTHTHTHTHTHSHTDRERERERERERDHIHKLSEIDSIFRDICNIYDQIPSGMYMIKSEVCICFVSAQDWNLGWNG